MDAERTFVAEDGTKIEEFYWAGKMVVYVNNTKSDKTFNELLETLGGNV